MIDLCEKEKFRTLVYIRQKKEEKKEIDESIVAREEFASVRFNFFDMIDIHEMHCHLAFTEFLIKKRLISTSLLDKHFKRNGLHFGSSEQEHDELK